MLKQFTIFFDIISSDVTIAELHAHNCHCCRMTIVPLAAHCGGASLAQLGDLLPIRRGNIIGGTVLVGASYSLAFGRLGGWIRKHLVTGICIDGLAHAYST